MALEFTEQEKIKISKYSKVTTPKWFNASAKSDADISRDFESWLILETRSTKEKLWELLRKNSNTTEDTDNTKDLQKLRDEMYNALKQVAGSKKDNEQEYLTFLSSIDERWREVFEIYGPILTELSKKYSDKDFNNYDWLQRIEGDLKNQDKDKTADTDNEFIKKQNDSFITILKDYDNNYR